MNIVDASAQGGSTYFYKVFEKKSNFSFQPIVLNFDTTTKQGDYFYATIPTQGRRILRMWLDLGSVPTSNLNTVDLLVDQVLVYSFPGEYIQIHNSLRTTASKMLPRQVLIPIMKYLPVVQNMQLRISVSGPAQSTDFKLFADWIFDNLPVDGEYVITQVQRLQAPTSNTGIRLNFYNVIKELIVVPDQGQISSMTLLLNDQKKFENTGDYFRYIQPMMYHTGNSLGVYLYSFSLFPEDEAPSGGLNFSRINNQRLVVKGPNNVRVYALNYNVLKVKDGKATVMFDNL